MNSPLPTGWRALLSPTGGVVVLCAWQALPPLVNAWRHSPFDRLGWIAFLLWLIPVGAVFLRPRSAGLRTGEDAAAPASLPGRRPALRVLSWIALIIVVLAVVVDMNALRYVALALALGAWMPRRAWAWVWLVLALAWMPALGWLGAGLKASGVNVLRVLLGALAAGLWARQVKKGLN